MAEAPGHLLGQIIGNTLEQLVKPVLLDVAERADLYLDARGLRPGVRNGQLLCWADDLGNEHDLDFVLERGGRQDKRGTPAAFIEVAWRRYTKHSKAKAQEIQAAVLPLLQTHANVKPIPAAVIAGEWTNSAVQQLVSSGFLTCKLDTSSMVAAFARFDLNILGQAEGTTDSFWAAQVSNFRTLSETDHHALLAELHASHRRQLDEFSNALIFRLTRSIDRVDVLHLYGTTETYLSAIEALESIEANGQESGASLPFQRVEIGITYSNGDSIKAAFGELIGAADFLRTFV